MLEIVLPPNRSPLLRPFYRSSAVAVGPAIEGLSTSERPTRYLFDLSSLPNGDYSADVSNPAAAFVFRVVGRAAIFSASFD